MSSEMRSEMNSEMSSEMRMRNDSFCLMGLEAAMTLADFRDLGIIPRVLKSSKDLKLFLHFDALQKSWH